MGSMPWCRDKIYYRDHINKWIINQKEKRSFIATVASNTLGVGLADWPFVRLSVTSMCPTWRRKMLALSFLCWAEMLNFTTACGQRTTSEGASRGRGRDFNHHVRVSRHVTMLRLLCWDFNSPMTSPTYLGMSSFSEIFSKIETETNDISQRWMCRNSINTYVSRTTKYLLLLLCFLQTKSWSTCRPRLCYPYRTIFCFTEKSAPILIYLLTTVRLPQ